MEYLLFFKIFVVTPIVFCLLGYEICRWAESKKLKSKSIDVRVLARVIAAELESIQLQKQENLRLGLDKLTDKLNHETIIQVPTSL